MRKKRIFISAVVVGITGLASAWLFGWFGGDPALAEVQQLQAKMAEPNLKDADRQALMQQMRGKIEGLSPDARRAVFENGRQMFEQRAEAHIDQILAMSQAERNKALDADIDRMEKMHAQREANAQTGAQPNAQNAQNGQRGQRGGQRGANLSDDQRVDRLRNRLDRSTPEMRAKRNVYIQLVNQRRQQRGLPPMTGRGGR
jgi:hypothetical protein